MTTIKWLVAAIGIMWAIILTGCATRRVPAVQPLYVNGVGFAVDFADMREHPNQSEREQRRDARRARRANMTTIEVIGDHFRERWGWYAAGAGLVVTDRVAASNDWLWYRWFGSSGGSGNGNPSSVDNSTQTTEAGNNTRFEIRGDNNTINYYPTRTEYAPPNGNGANGNGF